MSKVIEELYKWINKNNQIIEVDESVNPEKEIDVIDTYALLQKLSELKASEGLESLCISFIQEYSTKKREVSEDLDN